MKAAIIANGKINNYSRTKSMLTDCGYLTACDGGLRHCHAMNLKPDCIVGDFDSAQPEMLAMYDDVHKLSFAAEKDQTDLELALQHVLKLPDVDSIDIFGVFGGRVDHQFANIYLLVYAADKPVDVSLQGNLCIARLIKTTMTFSADDGHVLSLIPITEKVTGITTKGLKYPLYGESLMLGAARGVSNVIVEEEAQVTVKEGLLLAVQVRE